MDSSVYQKNQPQVRMINKSATIFWKEKLDDIFLKQIFGMTPAKQPDSQHLLLILANFLFSLNIRFNFFHGKNQSEFIITILTTLHCNVTEKQMSRIN
jgi:hypothetical protein